VRRICAEYTTGPPYAEVPALDPTLSQVASGNSPGNASGAVPATPPADAATPPAGPAVTAPVVDFSKLGLGTAASAVPAHAAPAAPAAPPPSPPPAPAPTPSPPAPAPTPALATASAPAPIPSGTADHKQQQPVARHLQLHCSEGLKATYLPADPSDPRYKGTRGVDTAHAHYTPVGRCQSFSFSFDQNSDAQFSSFQPTLPVKMLENARNTPKIHAEYPLTILNVLENAQNSQRPLKIPGTC